MDDGSYERTLTQWGIVLFPWQLFVLKVWLSVASGAFAYLTCCLTVPRQNGKTMVIIARILLGCIVFKENQLYTAQVKTTAAKVYREIRELIKANQKLQKYFTAEGIGSENPNVMEIVAFDPKTGARLGSCRFITRGSNSPARGDTISVTYFDEAQILTGKIYDSVAPASLTNEGGQEFFVGTASTVEEAAGFGKKGAISSAGTFFMDLRNNVKSGRKKDACWLEWGVDKLHEKDDLDAIYDSNPSIGLKMAAGKSVSLRKLLNFNGSTESFNTEHLGYWPSQSKERAIDISRWDDLTVTKLPPIEGSVRTAVAIKSNGNDSIDIAIAVRTEQTTYISMLPQIDIARQGIEPVWEAIKNYIRSGSCKAIVIDGKVGQFEILKLLSKHGYWNLQKKSSSQRKVSLTSPLDMAQAASTIITATIEKTVSPLAQPALRAAVEDAGKRAPRGSSSGIQGFMSMSGRVDVNPLETAALALHASLKQRMPNDREEVAETKDRPSNGWGEDMSWGSPL
jgi:hypothetical protein